MSSKEDLLARLDTLNKESTGKAISLKSLVLADLLACELREAGVRSEDIKL